MLVIITPVGGEPMLATVKSWHGGPVDPGFGRPVGPVDPGFGLGAGVRPGHELPHAPGHPTGPIFIPPGTTKPVPLPPDLTVDIGKDGYYAVWPALRQWGYAPVSATKPVPPEEAAPTT